MILFLFYIFHVHLKLRICFSRKCYIWTYNLCALYSRCTFCLLPDQRRVQQTSGSMLNVHLVLISSIPLTLCEFFINPSYTHTIKRSSSIQVPLEQEL